MPNLSYPASLKIDYAKERDRISSLFRLLLALPVVVLLSILTSAGGSEMAYEAGKEVSRSGSSIAVGLFAATALMIVFRQRYPR